MVIFIWALTVTLTYLSFSKNKIKTLDALRSSFLSLNKLLPAMLAMILFVGLILALFPKENLVEIFNHKGIYGFVLVSIIGAIITLPGPIAFPLAGALLKMGADQGLLASFITTLTMVGLATSPLESSYFGRKFTALRQGLSLIAAILIGLIMRAML